MSPYRAITDAPQGFDSEAVGFVACRLRKTQMAQGDVVYRRGEGAACAYIVALGRVTANRPKQNSTARRNREAGSWRRPFADFMPDFNDFEW